MGRSHDSNKIPRPRRPKDRMAWVPAGITPIEVVIRPRKKPNFQNRARRLMNVCNAIVNSINPKEGLHGQVCQAEYPSEEFSGHPVLPTKTFNSTST